MQFIFRRKDIVPAWAIEKRRAFNLIDWFQLNLFCMTRLALTSLKILLVLKFKWSIVYSIQALCQKFVLNWIQLRLLMFHMINSISLQLLMLLDIIFKVLNWLAQPLTILFSYYFLRYSAKINQLLSHCLFSLVNCDSWFFFLLFRL